MYENYCKFWILNWLGPNQLRWTTGRPLQRSQAAISWCWMLISPWIPLPSPLRFLSLKKGKRINRLSLLLWFLRAVYDGQFLGVKVLSLLCVDALAPSELSATVVSEWRSFRNCWRLFLNCHWAFFSSFLYFFFGSSGYRYFALYRIETRKQKTKAANEIGWTRGEEMRWRNYVTAYVRKLTLYWADQEDIKWSDSKEQTQCKPQEIR